MSIPELPCDTSLQLLAEGAANVVYKVLPLFPIDREEAHTSNEENIPKSLISAKAERSRDGAPPLTDGRLLRLGKALPSRVYNEQSHRYFHDVLKTLFQPKFLVSLDLVKIPRNIIDECNRRLRKAESCGQRRTKRKGLYLAHDEPYGLLITDMTPNADNGEILIEFKPKWLVQSPTAPPKSRRCRTCALRAHRNKARRLMGKSEEVFLCPLDLASQDRSRVERAVAFLIAQVGVPQSGPRALHELLVEYFVKSPVIRRLQQLQRDLDPQGVLSTDVKSSQFVTAMTLRDCTLYLKIPPMSEGHVEARLGDLDLKSPKEGKAEYWRALERQLIDEGWYTGTEDEPQADRVWCDLG